MSSPFTFSDPSCAARYGRLHSSAGAGAFCANGSIPSHLEVYFGGPQRLVGAVAMQGRCQDAVATPASNFPTTGVKQYVTIYTLQFSVDNGTSFAEYKEAGMVKHIPGSSDPETPAIYVLHTPTLATHIRFVARSVFGWASMRVEAYEGTNLVDLPPTMRYSALLGVSLSLTDPGLSLNDCGGVKATLSLVLPGTSTPTAGSILVAPAGVTTFYTSNGAAMVSFSTTQTLLPSILSSVMISALSSSPVDLRVEVEDDVVGSAGVGVTYFDDQAMSFDLASFEAVPFTNPRMTDTIAGSISFNWGTGPLYAGGAADIVSATFRGRILAPVTATYTFSTTADEMSVVWVDGVMQVRFARPQGPTVRYGIWGDGVGGCCYGGRCIGGCCAWNDYANGFVGATSIPLQAGRSYDFAFGFAEMFGGAYAELAWEYPSVSRQTVPATSLLRCPKFYGLSVVQVMPPLPSVGLLSSLGSQLTLFAMQSRTVLFSLTAAPDGLASISLRASSPSMIAVTPDVLDFTSADWMVPRPVLVTSVGAVGSTSISLQSEYGTGRGGDLNVTSSGVTINPCTYLTADASAGSSTISVANWNVYSTARELFLWQVQHSNASISGTYEFVQASSCVSPGICTLLQPLRNSYYASNGIAQVVRVAHYDTLTLSPGASIQAPPFSSVGTRCGGVIAARARVSITLLGGSSFNANGRGYAGGNCGSPCTGNEPGRAGEGHLGANSRGGTSGLMMSNGNGGGGGFGGYNYAGEPAAGGSHFTAGGRGIGNSPTNSYPGERVGYSDLRRIYFGGGGGGGGDNQGVSPFPVGGSGGGLIMLFAPVFSVSPTAMIDARGGDSVFNAASTFGGQSGGGAGGTIWIYTESAMNWTTLQARVDGGLSSSRTQAAVLNVAGAGGSGILRFQVRSEDTSRSFVNLTWAPLQVTVVAPPPAPTGVLCNGSSLTSVTVSWSPLVPAPLSYLLFAGAGPFSPLSTPTYSGPLLTAVVSGLPVGALASLALCAMMIEGMSQCSAFTCQALRSSNSTVSSVAPSAGALVPSFSPGVTAYTMSPFSQMTSSVSFSVATMDPTATVTVTPAVLSAGVNVITITSVAQDGVTSTRYTVTVTNPGPPIGPPAAPTFPAVQPLAVTVAWTLPATVPAFPVTNCTITRNDTVLTVSPGTSFVDPAVAPLTSYSYRVENCSNSLGVSTGGPGPAATVTTPYPAPVVTALLPFASTAAPSTAAFSPTLTVSGTSFGLTASHLGGVTVGGINATSFTWLSPTSVAFVVPGPSLAPPYTLPVQVTVAVAPFGPLTSSATGGVSLTVTAPIPPLAAPTPVTCAPTASDPSTSLEVSFNLTGQPAEVTGVSVSPGPSAVPRTAMRGAPDSLVFSGLSPATTMTFVVSSLSSTPGRVALSFSVTCTTAAAAAAASGGATVFGPAPTVTFVAPSSGPTTGGTLVTIRGTNLGVTASQLLDIQLDGVSCVFSKVWASASFVTCVSEPKAAPSAAPGSVTVKTFFGVSGGAGASSLFRYTPPGPLVMDFNPRVVSAAGGTVVTLLGSNFGTSAPAGLVATVSGAACSPARWLSQSTIACTTPPAASAGYNASAPSEVVLLVDGVLGRVAWSGPPPRFTYGTECIPACSWSVDCVAGQCSSCRPGLTGAPACTAPIFAVTALDELQTDESGARAVRVRVKVNLMPQAGAKPLAIDAVLTDPAEASVTPSTLRFAAGQADEAVVTVKGVNDNRRDGNVTFGLAFSVAPDADDVYLSASYLLAPATRIMCNDSAPQIVSIKPAIAPALGANVTMTIRDADPAFEVWVGPSIARVLILPARFASLQSQPPDEFTVEVPVSKEGYAPVTVVNFGGSRSTLRDELFISDACPQEGWYGKGASCRPCPKGAVCPGGQRMWPAEGFWNPGEDSGFVTPCDPPAACLGGKARSCRPGHMGTFCGECLKMFFKENGLCRPCPNKGGSIASFVILTVTWIVFALCVAMVKDQVTLSYIVIIFKSLQLLSTIGASSTGKLPSWVTGMYSRLAVFSGDLDFIQLSCVSRRPFSVNFFCVLAYSVIIFLPIPLFLPLVKWGTVTRAVRQGARPKRLQRIHKYFKDRLVRALTIWGSIVYQSVTALAMEALSCVPVRAGGGAERKYVMVTVPGQVCYKGVHLLLCVVAVLLLLGLSVGFPALMLRKIMTNPHRRINDKRFQERFSYFFEFYNVKHPWVWVFDFVAACVVASGKSFLRPHINYQMAVSVVVFGAKVLFIIVRRPYIDWLTDLIQGTLAVVSLIAINMNFFERRNITKSTLLSSGLAGCMFAIFFGVIAVLVVAVVYLLVVKKTKEEDDDEGGQEEEQQQRQPHELVGGKPVDGSESATPSPLLIEESLAATAAAAGWFSSFASALSDMFSPRAATREGEDDGEEGTEMSSDTSD